MEDERYEYLEFCVEFRSIISALNRRGLLGWRVVKADEFRDKAGTLFVNVLMERKW